MKMIITLSVLALLATTAFSQPAYVAVGGKWSATGNLTNHLNLGNGLLTNWAVVKSDGAVVIDDAYVTTQTPPITFTVYRTIGKTSLIRTNLAVKQELLTETTNSNWNNKHCVLHHASNDLWWRYVITNAVWTNQQGGSTAWNAIGVDPTVFDGSGLAHTNHMPRVGDRLYVLEPQAVFTLAVTNANEGINAGKGTPGTRLHFGILAGNPAQADQVVILEMVSAATAGTPSAVSTNCLKLLTGAFYQ